MTDHDPDYFRLLRDARIEASRLAEELQAAREADDQPQVSELQAQIRRHTRWTREVQAFVDLQFFPPELRPLVAQYYGLAALDLSNRADGVGPDNVSHTDALFAMWDQLREQGAEALPLGELAISPQDPAVLRQAAELFRRLAIAASQASG